MSGATAPDVVVLVFARAPRPGAAKTRLAPRLGAWGAARLQARLTQRALRTALEARLGAVELHGAPASHRFFRMLKQQSGVAIVPQRGADLGERMHRALVAALRRHRAAILIGSDCPALRAADLRRAARLLRGGQDAVLAPAEDGGYALVGLRRTLPRIFAAMPWGGASVFEETTRRLDLAQCRWRALRCVWDVDRPQDLERLRSLRFSSVPWRAARR